MRNIRLGFALCVASSLMACRAPLDEHLPQGYSEASHSNDAPPDYDKLFDVSRVHRIDIELDAVVYEEMLVDASVAVALDQTPMWAEVTVRFDDRTWEHVGMRFKGLGSIDDAMDVGSLKYPFRLKFDHFEVEHENTKNQRLFGFKNLGFANNVKDDSQLREVLMSELMMDGGAPAARAAFARIFIDLGEGPEYFGLYTMLEDPDEDAMQESQLGGKDGNLYEATSDWVTFREQDFEKSNNVEAGDFSDVEAAVSILNDASLEGADFRDGLEAVFDVDSFLRVLAVNMAASNADSYGCKSRNYYLYGSPDQGGALVWIPWDHDEAFHGSMASCGETGVTAAPDTVESILYTAPPVGFPLIERVLADSEYKERYVTYLSALVEGPLHDASFEARVNELAELVRPFVVGDEGEVTPYTNLREPEDFDRAIDGEEGLVPFMEQRVLLLEEAIESARAAQ